MGLFDDGFSDDDVTQGQFGGDPGGDVSFGGSGAPDSTRGFFDVGQNVEVVDRSFQSPGTIGNPISRDPEFARAKSDFQNGLGKLTSGLIGTLSGIPGLGAVINRVTSSGSFATDANGDMILGADANTSPENGRDLQTISAAMSAMEQSNVPIAVNDAGQLTDTTGDLVNTGGARIDANGRLMTDSDIAIQKSQGFLDQASTDATAALQSGLDASLGAVQSGTDQALQSNQSGFDAANAALLSGATNAFNLNQFGANQSQQFGQISWLEKQTFSYGHQVPTTRRR